MNQKRRQDILASFWYKLTKQVIGKSGFDSQRRNISGGGDIVGCFDFSYLNWPGGVESTTD